MPELALSFFPGTCSRVALAALEQTGLPYDTHLVRFYRGEHKQPGYLAINPKGKVPTLLVDNKPLTEIVSIVRYLTDIVPDAGLMPAHDDPLASALDWSGLVWCAATLHPIVTRLRMAPMFAGPENAGAVWCAADEAMVSNWRLLEQRLTDQPWMLGDTWSAIDAFVFWLWDTAVGADVDPGPYPALVSHAERSRGYPAMARALEVEGRAFAQIAAEGGPTGMPPSGKPTR